MHSPRAQGDKKLYQFTMKRCVEEQPNLTLRQEVVEGLLLEDVRRLRRARPRSASLGVVARGDTLLPRPGRRPDHRHVPQGAHAHRRGEDRRRPGRRRVRRGAERQPRRLRASSWPASRPARRAGSTAARSTSRSCEAAARRRRRRGRSASPPTRSRMPQIDLPHHLHERGGPRPDPRQPAPGPDVLRPDPEPRAALLPVASRTRSCASPTRTRHQIFLEPEGPQHARVLLQRHLHQPAERRAGRRCSS